MNLLPDDIDFRASAAAAAARVRGAKPSTDGTVGYDATVALKCIGANHGVESEQELVGLEDERRAAPLVAAARTLVSVAENLRKQGGEHASAADGLLLYAAIAYGMHGNFPSARATLIGVSNEYVSQTAARRIAVTICDPAKSPALRLEPGVSRDEVYFHDHWSQALEVPDEKRLRQCLGLFGQFALRGELSDRGLLLSAEVAARQAFRLSTAHLKMAAPEVPTWFVSQLLRTNRNTLLPPQRQLLSDQHVASSANNALLNLPTSTGKTLIAEACIATAIREGGIAVFVAPYVAIGEQVLRSLTGLFRRRANVVAMFGGFKSDLPDVDFEHPQVIVATPERFDGILRTGKIIPALKLVVFDEFHLVENGARGTKLEGVVARLRLLQEQGMDFRLMALSAVLPKSEKMCAWLNVSKSDYHRLSWRPTARRLAVCRSDGRMFWVYGTDPLRPDGRTARDKIGGNVQVEFPHRMQPTKSYPPHSRSADSAENVAALAWDLATRTPGPGLIVCPRKADTRTVARAIARLSSAFEASDSLVAVATRIEQRYSWLAPLADCMRKGVAFHNASLPFDVRRDVEMATRELMLKFVASTTTLAEGADLPFRWTLLSHWLTGVHEGASPVKSLTFRNIAGRSGRANVYSEGDTVVYENLLGHVGNVGDKESRTQRLQRLLFEQTPLQSTLAVSAVPLDDTQRAAVEASFASQLLAAIPENPNDDDIAKSLARSTYAWVSGGQAEVTTLTENVMNELMDDSLPGGALAVVNSPAKLTDFGRAANRTGFSPNSCRAMVEFLSANDFPTEKATLLTNVLEAFSQLPEQTEGLLTKIYGGERYRSFVRSNDVPFILQQLLENEVPRDIFDALPKRVTSTGKEPYIEGQFDEFMRFVDSALMVFLPWVLRKHLAKAVRNTAHT